MFPLTAALRYDYGMHYGWQLEHCGIDSIEVEYFRVAFCADDCEDVPIDESLFESAFEADSGEAEPVGG